MEFRCILSLEGSDAKKFNKIKIIIINKPNCRVCDETRIWCDNLL